MGIRKLRAIVKKRIEEDVLIKKLKNVFVCLMRFLRYLLPFKHDL